MKTKLYYFFLAFAFIALSVSCSKDEDSEDNNNNNSGGGNSETVDSFINISISGDETGEFSSDSNSAIGGSENSGYEFIISRGPDDALSNQTFGVFLLTRYSETPQLPVPAGTFNLIAENDIEYGDGNYAIMFTNFETGTSFGYEVDGTLNITESNDDFLEGNFSFTTTSFTNGESEIQVEGSFLAPTSY